MHTRMTSHNGSLQAQRTGRLMMTAKVLHHQVSMRMYFGTSNSSANHRVVMNHLSRDPHGQDAWEGQGVRQEQAD